MAVVVTVAKGYDLGYIWKTQGETTAGHGSGGYYINAAQAGGGDPAPGPSASLPASSSSASPTTRSTGKSIRAPGPSSGGPAAAIRRSPITWPG